MTVSTNLFLLRKYQPVNILIYSNLLLEWYKVNGKSNGMTYLVRQPRYRVLKHHFLHTRMLVLNK